MEAVPTMDYNAKVPENLHLIDSFIVARSVNSVGQGYSAQANERFGYVRFN